MRAEGDWPVKPALPFIPEHEVAGVVAAVGVEVKHLKEGDVVGVAWLHDACGACEHCITGWETLCPTQHNTGYSVDGGYADTCWPMQTTWRAYPQTPTSLRWRPFFALALLLKASEKPKPSPANGWRSPVSAV